MIKKIFAILVLSLFFILPIKTFAEEPTGSSPIFTPFCFTAASCGEESSGCSGNGVLVHRARLTVGNEKPQPNSKVYVVTCLSDFDGQHCTSGNASVDALLTYPPMLSGYNYVFEGLFKEDGTTQIDQATNTLTANAAGELSVPALEWQDASIVAERRFLGISETQPVPTINPGLGLGGQQQSEIPKFDFSAALTNCIPLAWDPDGVVFDSQSLEPIPGASVTLTKKRDTGNFSMVNKFDPKDVPDGILTNPFLTKEDGGFSFFVPDGTYKLTPQIVGYNFPGILTLNPNYAKIYTNIYPLLSGLEIVEKGGPQHRDIPVDSVTGQPTYFPVKIIAYNYQSDRISSVFVDGKVSHPLAKIDAYSVISDPNNPEKTVRYKLIKTTQADKIGHFSLVINQSTFDKTKGEMFGEVEVTKADFGHASTDTKSAPAVLKLNPILTYIEGDALNQSQTLPEAKVELLLNSSIKPYYVTTADNKGHFKISSDYIPFMPYTLRYSLGGVVVNVTTSKFIAENSKSIKDNKTNLFYPNYSNPKTNESIKKSITAYNDQLNNGNRPTNQADTKTVSNQSASKNLTFILIVISIVILLTVVAFIGVYLIKKKQNQIDQML